MKIAMVTPYLPPRLGGREYWVPSMSKSLQNLGHTVKIYCANVDDFHKSSLKVRLGYFNGVPFHKASTLIDFSKFSTPITFPPFKSLRKFNPDIIHIHEPNLIITTALAMYGKFLLRKKIVMHNYSDPFDWLGGNFLFKLSMVLYKFLHKLKLKTSDRVVVISTEYFENARYFKPFQNKIDIIPMCLSDKFNQLEAYSKRETIIYAGRLDKRKGIDILIRAMEFCENCKLQIVGTGERETVEELKIITKKVILENKKISIEFLGNKTQEELNLLLNKAAMLILPTSDKTAETFGAVLIEAWATGIPVISANNPAPAKLVRESKGGILFERTNVKELANSINYLLSNSHEAQEMGENGKLYVSENFSFGENAKKLIELYNNVIKK